MVGYIDLENYLLKITNHPNLLTWNQQDPMCKLQSVKAVNFQLLVKLFSNQLLFSRCRITTPTSAPIAWRTFTQPPDSPSCCACWITIKMKPITIRLSKAASKMAKKKKLEDIFNLKIEVAKLPSFPNSKILNLNVVGNYEQTVFLWKLLGTNFSFVVGLKYFFTGTLYCHYDGHHSNKSFLKIV